MKDDGGDRTVLPLGGEEGLELEPRPVDVEGRKPPGGERAVPIPLVGIEPGRRNGVTAPVVAGEDEAGLVVESHGRVSP